MIGIFKGMFWSFSGFTFVSYFNAGQNTFIYGTLALLCYGVFAAFFIRSDAF